MAAHAAKDSYASTSTRSPEFEKQIDEVQARLRAFIEATRPAHEANLRNASLNANPAPKAQNSKEKKMPSTAVTHAKNLLRVSKTPARKTAAPPQFLHSTPDLARHRRKCGVCHHPEREAIEELFIHWHSPEAICGAFPEESINWISVYRHAHALGLDEIRRRNLRFVFEHVLDQADQITPTSAGIIAAARALGSCVDDNGRWSEPPKQVVVTTIVKKDETISQACGASQACDNSSVRAEAENQEGGANRDQVSELEIMTSSP